MSFPNIKIGLLNVTWTNGSREKPLNPIPIEIIAQFEDCPDLDINWLNNQIGLITLKGDYNYLIFDHSQFYTLEKTRVLDIEKSIFVYTLTKDIWQTFINNPNIKIQGHLIKTSNEKTLYQYLQYTKLAALNINSERVLLTNPPGEKTGKKQYLSNTMEIIPFERDENEKIVKFGHTKRFIKSEFEAFKKKLTEPNYSQTIKKPNQIVSYCTLRKVPKWQNYIAKIVENFLTKVDFDDPLILGVTQNVSTISSKLNTELGEASAEHNKYLIHRKQNLTNSTIEEQWVIKLLNLNEITEIIQVDKTTLKEITKPTKNITDFPENPLFKGLEKNNKTWILKNKLFSPVIDPSKYQYLNTSTKVFNEDYLLNTEKLVESDVKSLSGEYKEHKYNFSDSLVPAVYYPNWAETIQNNELKALIKQQGFSTEIGFLLYKFADFNKVYLDLDNPYIYGGENLSLTTGLKIPSRDLNCTIVKTLDEKTTQTNKKVAFTDLYREDINKSFWLTLWSVYLWQGNLDRVFESVSPRVLENNFKYTVGQCYIDENGEIYKKDDEASKKPSYDVDIFNPLSDKEKFKKVLTELTQRRKDIEINQPIYFPYLERGDILWNEVQSGFFYKNEEIKFDNTTLIVFGDNYYSYIIRQENLQLFSLGDKDSNYGYKFGLLSMYEPKFTNTPENNLITRVKQTPKIGLIKTLLTDKSKTETHNYEPYASKLRFFIEKQCNQDYPNHPFWHGRTQRTGLERLGHAFVGVVSKGVSWGKIDNRGEPRFFVYTEKGEDVTNKWYSYWPKHNGQLDWITGCRVVTKNDYYYIKLDFENSWDNLYFYSQNTSIGSSYKVSNYVYSNLTKNNFRKSRAILSRKSWSTIQQTGFYASGSDVSKLVEEAYKTANGETITNGKYFDIDENYLKTETVNRNPILFAFKSGFKTAFYVAIIWNSQTNSPDIEIIINNYSLLTFEPAKVVTLEENTSIKNTNLPQLINQRNFLYAYGEYMELQTKILNPLGEPNFILKVENIDIKDPTTNHYRIYFESDIEHLKKYITVARIETTEKAKTLTDKEWLNFKLEQDYRRKTEDFERSLNKETERLTNQNYKNSINDFALEKGNFYLQNMLNAAGQVSGGLVALSSGVGALGAAGIATGAAGAYLQYEKQRQQLEIKSRNLDQQDVENAFKITYAKNTMDERHKNAELREQETLYKLVNVDITKIPNSADVLDKMEESEGILNHICIFSRIPTGSLLEYLTQYHKIYGYSLDVNNFSLSVKDINESVSQEIYQFSRIDKLDITDLYDYEQIKGCFINGIFLFKHEYKLNHLSYLELKRKHNEKIAIERAKVLEAQKLQRKKELEEIAAASKGVELAKTDYSEKVERVEECESELSKKEAELIKVNKEIERLKESINVYKVEESHDVKKCLEDILRLNTEKTALESAKNEALEKVEELKNLPPKIVEKEVIKEVIKEVPKEIIKEVIREDTTKIQQLTQQLEELTKKKDKLEEAISTEKQSVNTLLTYKQEAEEKLKKIPQLEAEIKELKEKPVEDSENVRALKDALEELAKKKTRLKALRIGYKICWQTIIGSTLYSKEGKGYHNYIRYWRPDFSYDYLYKNNIRIDYQTDGEIYIKDPNNNDSGSYLLCGKGEDGWLSLISEDSHYQNYNYSGYYKGFKLYLRFLTIGGCGTEWREMHFQYYYLVDYFMLVHTDGSLYDYGLLDKTNARAVEEFRSYGEGVIKGNKAIWKQKREIADYLRTMKWASKTFNEAGFTNVGTRRQYIIDSIRSIQGNSGLTSDEEAKLNNKYTPLDKDLKLFDLYADIWEMVTY